MHAAAQNGKRNIVEYLLTKEGGGRLLNARDSAGRTPLAYALQNLRLKGLAQWLREEAGATAPPFQSTVPRPDLSGLPGQYLRILEQAEGQGWNALRWEGNFTMLHYAAQKGDYSLCDYLLHLGAKSNAYDSNGRTPLELAEEGGHEEVVELFRSDTGLGNQAAMVLSAFRPQQQQMQRRSLPSRVSRTSQWSQSFAPSMCSDDTSRSNNDVQKIPPDYLKVMDEIEKVGWDKMHWARGYTLLHWAAKHNNESLCAQFMWQGADANQQDATNRSAFDYARESGATKALAQLTRGPPRSMPPLVATIKATQPRYTQIIEARPISEL